MPKLNQPSEILNSDAFVYHMEPGADDEKAIRSVAYLLELGGDAGNMPLDGLAVAGLANILRRATQALGRRPVAVRDITARPRRRKMA